MKSVKEYNDLYDQWYEADNRADKYQCLFYLALFFVVIFGLALLTLLPTL